MLSSRVQDDERWMRVALEEARRASGSGEVPVAALITRGDTRVAIASNRSIRGADPTAHAEMLAIRAAAEVLGDWRLTGCSLYVTLEPCAMCAGAIVLARIDRVVFGAWDEKAGMAGSRGDLLRHPALNHHPEVAAGVLSAECGQLLTDFFGGLRG